MQTWWVFGARRANRGLARRQSVLTLLTLRPQPAIDLRNSPERCVRTLAATHVSQRDCPTSALVMGIAVLVRQGCSAAAAGQWRVHLQALRLSLYPSQVSRWARVFSSGVVCRAVR